MFLSYLRSKPLFFSTLLRKSKPLFIPTTTPSLIKPYFPENVGAGLSFFRPLGVHFLSSGSSKGKSSKKSDVKGKGKLQVEPRPEVIEISRTLCLDNNLGKDFKNFIHELRDDASMRKEGVNVGILFPSTAPLYISLRISNMEVTFHIRKNDFYLLGFKVGNGKWFELCREGSNLITDSVPLGISEGYYDMGFKEEGSLEKVMIGHQNLVDSLYRIKKISAYQGRGKLFIDDDDKKAIAIICLMVCETSRFESVLDHVVRLYRGCGEVGKYAKTVRNWSLFVEAFYKEKHRCEKEKTTFHYKGSLRLAP